MAKLRKKELIDIVAHKSHMPKRAAKEAVNVFLDEIGRFLAKGLDSQVLISGFGAFRTIRMKGKNVTIPNTEEIIHVKSHLYPSFTPGERLKKQVKR